MHDPVLVKVVEAVQQLEEDGLDHAGWYGTTRWLGVVVDDLKQVVLAVLKDHEDAFVFENNFDQMNEVRMREFGAQRHLTNSRLREASVLDIITFLLRLELLDRIEFFASCRACSVSLGVTLDRFVDSAISTTADEPYNVILLVYLGLRGVSVSWLPMLKPISVATEGDMASLLVLLSHR